MANTIKTLLVAATIAAGALGAVAVASAASADDGRRGPGGRLFERFDEDGDGRIAIADIEAEAGERLKAIDADNDGFVTRKEAEAHRDAMREEVKARFFPDANGDGVVDRGEFESAQRERFNELDANGDGVLSAHEARPNHGKRGHRRGR